MPINTNTRLYFNTSVYNTDTMLQWGNLTGTLIQKGRKMSVMDSLITATALQHQLQLVTRNQADFLETGLVLINPWES